MVSKVGAGHLKKVLEVISRPQSLVAAMSSASELLGSLLLSPSSLLVVTATH
jgi:hypothetical protein